MRCELLVISCGTVQRKAKEGKEVSMVVTNPFLQNLPEEEMINWYNGRRIREFQH